MDEYANSVAQPVLGRCSRTPYTLAGQREFARANRAIEWLGAKRWLLAFLFALLTPCLPQVVRADALFPTYIDIATDVLGAHSIEGADLDLDGDLDLISASRQDGRLRWHRNEQQASSVTPIFTSLDIDTVKGIYIAVPGDIDGDGDIDIAVAAVSEVRPSSLVDQANGGAGTVLWYENHGLAQFQGHVIYENLDYPVSIHLADLDRDGDLDLLSASRDDNRVLWYENDGDRTDPTFTSYTLTDRAFGAVSVSTADFDGDGDLDVVTASEDDDQIAWYENIGPQPLRFVTHIIQQAMDPTPSDFDFAKSVYGADVDGDGDMDIVYGSENDNLLGWYENEGGRPPVFVQHTVSTQSDHAKFVTAADVDLDGDTDLFVASTGDDTVAWYENNGEDDPGFQRHVVTNQAIGARYVHVADVDGDGDPDLLIASRFDNRIIWYQNRTIHRSADFPTSGTRTIADGIDWVDAAAADLDDDGQTDIVMMGASSLSWYRSNNKDASAFSGQIIANGLSGGSQATVVDLNHDGRRDVIYVAAFGATLGWYENVAGVMPSFQGRLINENAGEIVAIEVADIDGDGDHDIGTAGVGGVDWYDNRGGSTPVLSAQTVSDDHATALAVADLDQDGRRDLVIADAEGRIVWHRNEGSNPLTWRAIEVANNLSPVDALVPADIDRDGDIDLLSLSREGGTVTWHENRNGEPLRFVPTRIDTGLATGVHLEAADLDQDGDLDLLVGREGDPSVWYEHHGESTPTFTRRTLTEDRAQLATSADINGDSHLDLVAIDNERKTVQWIANGGGQFGAGASVSSPSWFSLAQPIELASLSVTHRGRWFDSDVSIAELVVQISDSNGRPLTSAEVQQRYRQFYLYRDRCCASVYDADVDDLTAEINAVVTTDDGQVKFDLSADDPNLQIRAQETGTFFIAASLHSICDIGTAQHQITFFITDGMAIDAMTGAALDPESSASGVPPSTDFGFDANVRAGTLQFQMWLPMAHGVPDCAR